MFNKIIKAFIYTVVLVLCGLIVFRCCANADRSAFTELTVTPALTEAWADGEMEILRLNENASEIAPDGYFTAYGFRYVPEAKQLQVTVRFNVSTWEYLNLPAETPMDFFLCKNDDPATFRAPDLMEEDSKSIYRYRKLVWNDVEIGDDNWQVYMDRKDGKYSVAPIRYVEQEYKTYKLSGGEKKQLRSQN